MLNHRRWLTLALLAVWMAIPMSSRFVQMRPLAGKHKNVVRLEQSSRQAVALYVGGATGCWPVRLFDMDCCG